MFFNFTPTQEPPTQATATEPAQEETSRPKLRFLQGADGKVVIDGEGLTKVISTSGEPPDEEALRLTSKWIHNVVSKEGRVGAWVPLARLPEWQAPATNSQ